MANCVSRLGWGTFLGSCLQKLVKLKEADMTAKTHALPLVAATIMALLLVLSVGSTCFAKPQSAADSARAEEKSFPSPDEFVAVDVQPVLESQPQVTYPDSAKNAGIEGKVRVKVLVDKQGKVRDALIEKGSGTKVGFEEAALEAAKQATWKPALLKDKPIPIWVSYEIKFQMKSGN